ncbi:MAG TPA: glycosyltransferase family 1 protein, partial [Candidatus Moranbacteria bacterium]|nr:glycosyltransferase family 1 protein [Candidatus Moranbacteria bacterium]
AAKRDILRFYPRLAEERVVVIEHGVDREFFAQKFPSERVDETLSRFDLRAGGYILYVGALQPRKNLRTLIAAFESLADDFGDLKLVLAGEVGWLAEGILRAVATSPFAERIVLTGGLPFEEVVILLQRATVFAFVPLYEGFGLPILEAFAAGTPVLTAENSSLPEVAAEAAEYCRAEEVASVEAGLRRLLADENLRNRLVAAGRKRVGRYDWDRCARRTLAVLHGEL